MHTKCLDKLPNSNFRQIGNAQLGRSSYHGYDHMQTDLKIKGSRLRSKPSKISIQDGRINDCLSYDDVILSNNRKEACHDVKQSKSVHQTYFDSSYDEISIESVPESIILNCTNQHQIDMRNLESGQGKSRQKMHDYYSDYEIEVPDLNTYNSSVRIGNNHMKKSLETLMNDFYAPTTFDRTTSTPPRMISHASYDQYSVGTFSKYPSFSEDPKTEFDFGSAIGSIYGSTDIDYLQRIPSGSKFINNSRRQFPNNSTRSRYKADESGQRNMNINSLTQRSRSVNESLIRRQQKMNDFEMMQDYLDSYNTKSKKSSYRASQTQLGEKTSSFEMACTGIADRHLYNLVNERIKLAQISEYDEACQNDSHNHTTNEQKHHVHQDSRSLSSHMISIKSIDGLDRLDSGFSADFQLPSPSVTTKKKPKKGKLRDKSQTQELKDDLIESFKTFDQLFTYFLTWLSN